MPPKAAAKKTTTKPKAKAKTSTGTKKPLTTYQKFVKSHFKTVGTASSTAPEKMVLIGKLWQRTKK
jgi:hypothetical protein